MAAGATARWLVLLLVAVSAAAAAAGKHDGRWRGISRAVGGQVVEKERRRVVADAEAGTVTAVDVADAAGAAYRLHFIAMDPGALFLPVQLHADMVFYVHSGRGKVTYIEEDSGEKSSLEVERGDVYNLEQGSILYIQSYPNATRQRLRIYAIFTSDGINAEDPSKPKVEAYSSVSNLLKGFETEVLRRGFGVHREVAEAIKSAKTPPPIIPYNPQEKGGDEEPNWTEDIVDALLGVRDPEEFLNKKKKDKHTGKIKAFNFYSGKPDVHNCYGWSRTMTNKDLDALHGSNIGMFMANLTTGSMVGPHWNPKAAEIAIVTDGSGIVQTVCPSSGSSSPPSGESRRGHRGGAGGRGDEGGEGGARCRSSVFRVKEGDVFVVPRFHPMAHMSFNNDSFVFVGFSTHMGENHPQFLAGKGSVLQAIGKEVLALSLGQPNSTAVEKLLSAQRDSTILSCISSG
ncbi:globulin-1 S allele [Panicum miliaceum]|uniref:Globulin-1 S allele n=1 Tax=Panicum miliaceum TaxID=4540 RepID=A0A3L6TRT4_PANMI|nr:globulin-1 S allele [Panicum miliaceum]